jgi:hypothetical protein
LIAHWHGINTGQFATNGNVTRPFSVAEKFLGTLRADMEKTGGFTASGQILWTYYQWVCGITCMQLKWVAVIRDSGTTWLIQSQRPTIYRP